MTSQVLVTGATGFIGKCLLKHLLQRQFKVRVLIRNIQKAPQLPGEVEIFEGDLTDTKSLIGVCNDIDMIFHLGGYAHAWSDRSKSSVENHYAINFQGTKNILEEAIRVKAKRFVFFSSVKAVGDSEKYIDEQWDEMPYSPYGMAKREAEKLVLAAKSQGMHVCVLRLALVYGPGWKGNLANMLRAIDRGLFLPIPEVYNHRSMISIEDVCSAAMLAAFNSKANGQVYFLTDGVDYSTRQLYIMMRTALGKSIPKWYIPLWVFKFLAYVGDIGGKLTHFRLPFNTETMSKLFGSACYNSQHIQHDLDFKPKDDLKKMLPDIIAEYRASCR